MADHGSRGRGHTHDGVNYHHSHESPPEDHMDQDEEDLDSEEASHYQGIIHAFSSYPIFTHMWVSRMERNWSRLPPKHRQMLPTMPERLLRIRQASKLNFLFFQRMLQHENMFQQGEIVRSQISNLFWFSHILTFLQEKFALPKGAPVSDQNVDKVHSTLRQLVREWSAFGAPERQQCYQPFLDELQKRLPVNDSNRFKCLFPMRKEPVQASQPSFLSSRPRAHPGIGPW